MSDYFSDFSYKCVIKCLVLKFTIYGRTCNTQLVHNPGNRNTAVFYGFLQYLTLMRHRQFFVKRQCKYDTYVRNIKTKTVNNTM